MGGKVLLTASVTWPSIARLAAGFATAGLAVEALAPAKAPVLASRYVSRGHAYNPLKPLAALRAAIHAAKPDLLVACDDRAVAQLLRLHESERVRGGDSPVAQLIARSLGAPGSYADIVSRHRAMEIAAELGIRVPQTYPVATERELEDSLTRIGLPAVVKADGSWGGDGVIIARDREEARAAFRKLSRAPSRLRCLARALRRRDPHYVAAALAPETYGVCVQHFIAGAPAASAFACWNGEIVADIAYDVLVADAAIGPPNVIRRIEDAEISRAARLLARHFGLSGLHGLDFIRDADGAVHLLEINPRATQGGTLAFGQGHDLPGALAACIVSAPVPLREAIANDVVVLFPREWRRDPESAYLKTGHHDVPWDDPAVFRAALSA